MEVTEFGHFDFVSPSSEQTIWTFRGDKREFDSPLFFWVKTLQSQGWEGREEHFRDYAEGGQCRPITGAEFTRIVAEYSGSLRRPLPAYLLDASRYLSALQMYADWNDVAVVAETDEAFIAFYWSTTA